MSALVTPRQAPRYGSAAELAEYAGLSVKTVRRLVDAGKVRGLKVGRRLLVPFEDMDRLILGRSGRLNPERDPIMATVQTTAATEAPYVPPVSAEEQARRNQAAIELLDAWEAEGDEQEQRETMNVLREGLGKGRVLSSRKLFP